MNNYQVGDIISGLLMESKGFVTCDDRSIQTKKEDLYMYIGEVIWTEQEIYKHCYYHFPSGGLIPFNHKIVTPYYDNNK